MKKTRNIGLLVLMATSLGQLNATQTTGGLPFETTATVFHPTDTPASVHGRQFRQLPQVWDEGIPLGNGIMGALIWQKDDRLRLALDRADLWDLRPVKEFSGSDYTFRFICEAVEKKDMSPVYRLIDDRTSIDIAPSKIPAGAIEIPIAGLRKVKSTELDVHTAVCTITWENGTTAQIFTNATDKVGHFRFTHLPQKPEILLEAPSYEVPQGTKIERNSLARRMIENSIRHLLQSLPMRANPVSIDVLISVPGGEEIARRTFNPRLGIEGGISIIGTSGIVKPFSTDAFIRSIAKSMEVARATGSPRVVINSGAKSERFVRAYYPDLPPQAFVHYGNFIGETLKLADSLNVPRITLGVMIGKAVKLAEGHLDTHSRQVTMNRNFIISMAREAGCGEDVCTRIDGITLARELWDLIPASLLPTFTQTVIDHCHHHCAPLLPHGELTILLISEDGRIYA